MRVATATAAFLLLAAALVPTAALADKSYLVTGVAIEALADSGGRLQVRETRSYRFKGRFKYAYRTFSRHLGMEYGEFAVGEDGVRYRPDDSEEPGTYQLRDQGDRVEVRWFFAARNESRTFTVSYEVDGAIVRHPDATVLHYQFLGDEFKKPSANVTLSVQPPGGLRAADVRQWLHGPLWAESRTGADGTITAWCERLPARRFLDLRALYPAGAFPGAPVDDEPIVSAVLADEAQRAEEANRQRLAAQAEAARRVAARERGRVWMPLLALAGLAGWILIFRRYGTRPEVSATTLPTAHVPSDLPPALVAYLLDHMNINGNALMGTLVDLASRGYITFHEHTDERKVLGRFTQKKHRHYWLLQRDHLDAHRDELLPFERSVLDFVFAELGGGDRADMDLFKKHRSKSQKFFRKWKEDVKREGRRRGFYDEESFSGRTVGMLWGGGLMVTSAVCGLFFYEWALLPGVMGLILLLVSLGIVHRTRDGAMAEAQWKRLRGHLKVKRWSETEPLDNLDRYLVYGVGLGIGKQALERLGNRIPNGHGGVYVAWYHGGHSGAASFGTAFSAAVAAAGSSMSSAAGAGGGASGGAGGGGGGGGGAG